MLSPPKPLDEIQTNLVRVTHMNGGGGCKGNKFRSRPLGMGLNVKYHEISITKSISKFFYAKNCVFLQIRDKITYRTGFLL